MLEVDCELRIDFEDLNKILQTATESRNKEIYLSYSLN